MRGHWILVSFLLVMAASAGAHEPSKKSDAEAQVREVLMQNARGFETANFALLDGLWAHDESVTVFESGYANYGWEDYRDHHLKPEVEEMKSVVYRLSDIAPRIDGNTAWATFKYTISADFKGQKIDSAGLGTAVLENRIDGWKIVHWHTSAPRKKPATEQKAAAN
ncbi:MAG TPA: nuclear transport factor 2 family protein [Thermoanaerobaculia bacterium]